MPIRHLFFALLVLFLASSAWGAENSPSIYRQAGNWQVYGESPDYLVFGLGGFDTDEKASGAAKIEWRGGDKAWFVGPAAGLIGNTDGGMFGYGGIYADIAWRRLVLTPFFGAGLYEEGDGKSLGGVFQFRSALTLAYRFEGGSRMGFQYAHVSNADLHDENPGEQDLFLSFAWPF